MDRHNIPTYLPESFHCTRIKDYYLKESIFDKNNDLFLTGGGKTCCSSLHLLSKQLRPTALLVK
jgi:hypothetical protein